MTRQLTYEKLWLRSFGVTDLGQGFEVFLPSHRCEALGP